MRFIRDKKYLAIATVVTVSLASCTTTSEDDNRLEDEDPIEAASMSEDEELGDPSTAPEAKPSESIAVPSAQPTPAEPVPPPAAESRPVVEPKPAAQSYAGSVRRVMYVKFDGVALREQPDSKSRKLGTLDKGDHLLVTIEGEWARTDDGKYIKAKSLSEKGVGRSKRDASWSPGSGASEPIPAAPKSGDKNISRKLPAKTRASAKAGEAKPEAGGDMAPPADAVDSQP